MNPNLTCHLPPKPTSLTGDCAALGGTALGDSLGGGAVAGLGESFPGRGLFSCTEATHRGKNKTSNIKQTTSKPCAHEAKRINSLSRSLSVRVNCPETQQVEV